MREGVSVLIIEDEQGMREACLAMLRGALGIEHLFSASTLAAGLTILGSGVGPGIDVILLDLRLPDSDGADTLEAITAAYPEIPVVVMTGMYLDRPLLDALVCGGAFAILDKAKMFRPNLFEWVDRAIRHRHLRVLVTPELRPHE